MLKVGSQEGQEFEASLGYNQLQQTKESCLLIIYTQGTWILNMKDSYVVEMCGI